jgi:hypothetical protein
VVVIMGDKEEHMFELISAELRWTQLRVDKLEKLVHHMRNCHGICGDCIFEADQVLNNKNNTL